MAIDTSESTNAAATGLLTSAASTATAKSSRILTETRSNLHKDTSVVLECTRGC